MDKSAGAAVLSDSETLWASALPPSNGANSQRPRDALKLGKGKRLNIYTDNRYAFATACVHGAIYQEKGLLTAGGKT